MKKFLLTLACVAAFAPAFAQDAETTALEVITENENGTVTITENFATISDSEYAKRFRGATTATTPTEWTIEDGAVVDGKSFKSDFVVATTSTPGYLRTLAYKGAYFSFTLPSYNCSQITLQSYGSTVGGEFDVYAGDVKLETITIVKGQNNNGAIVISIPEANQAAGTEYKFVNVLGGKDENDNLGNFRLQIESASFVCTPKVEMTPWAAPELVSLADGDYIINGQTLRFSCEDGGTINGEITCKNLGTDGSATFTGSEYVFDGPNVALNANIYIDAYVSGAGHSDSETVRWTLKFNKQNKMVLVKNEFSEIVSGKNCATFYYDISVLNFLHQETFVTAGKKWNPITITATLTNVDDPSVTFSVDKVIEPEVAAAAQADEASEITPINPDNLSGSIEVTVKNSGKYTASMKASCVSFSNGQALALANGETSTDIEITIPTGIENVEAVEGNEAEVIYYNLNGVRVQPAQGMGLLIRVAAGKATKVIF